ncbi:suppressor protein SRP40-like [Cimex lectularius]|uniref:Uncharacterized protein n=1 Tax=Cimex lectularius TaxID=79782 RepID=A0A8I6S9F0_CIMLE|nr:suppressor protein SRP40-like [Cimex lectularius]
MDDLAQVNKAQKRPNEFDDVEENDMELDLVIPFLNNLKHLFGMPGVRSQCVFRALRSKFDEVHGSDKSLSNNATGILEKTKRLAVFSAKQELNREKAALILVKMAFKILDVFDYIFPQDILRYDFYLPSEEAGLIKLAEEEMKEEREFKASRRAHMLEVKSHRNIPVYPKNTSIVSSTSDDTSNSGDQSDSSESSDTTSSSSSSSSSSFESADSDNDTTSSDDNVSVHNRNVRNSVSKNHCVSSTSDDLGKTNNNQNGKNRSHKKYSRRYYNERHRNSTAHSLNELGVVSSTCDDLPNNNGFQTRLHISQDNYAFVVESDDVPTSSVVSL